MSVNEAWQGKRFKTPAYHRYERDCQLIMPYTRVPEGILQIHLCFGVSNMQSDWDNPIKPFQDIMQKRYGFNDARIVRAVVDKVKTGKGEEFVMFDLLPFERQLAAVDQECK